MRRSWPGLLARRPRRSRRVIGDRARKHAFRQACNHPPSAAPTALADESGPAEGLPSKEHEMTRGLERRSLPSVTTRQLPECGPDRGEPCLSHGLGYRTPRDRPYNQCHPFDVTRVRGFDARPYHSADAGDVGSRLRRGRSSTVRPPSSSLECGGPELVYTSASFYELAAIGMDLRARHGDEAAVGAADAVQAHAGFLQTFQGHETGPEANAERRNDRQGVDGESPLQ